MKCLLIVNSMPDILFLWADQSFTNHINKQSVNAGLADEGLKEVDLNAATQFFIPLITSVFYMKELGDPYSSITCDNGTIIVFKQFYELCFLAFNGDGDESEDFLKRKLSVLYRIATMHFGASLELLKPDVVSSRKRIWNNLGSLIDTWSVLSTQQQCFLVEAIERIQLNQPLSEMSIGLLNTALGMARNKGNENAIHALLLVNSKLLALYSSRNALELEAADILMITVFVNKIFHHPPQDIPCSLNRVPPPLSYQFLEKGGPTMAYAVRTGNNTNSSPAEQSLVMGSTPFLQGSALSAPVDIALPNNFISKDNESQGSSGDEFYSPPSTPPNTPGGYLSHAAGVRDSHFDTVSRDTYFTPCANTPERIRKLQKDTAKPEVRPCTKADKSGEEEAEVEFRSGYFRQTVFLHTPKCPYVPHVLHFVQISPGTVLVLVSEVKLSQVTIPIYQALSILTSLETKPVSVHRNTQQAQSQVDRIDSLIKKIVDHLIKVPVGAAVENQLRILQQWWEKVKRKDLHGFLSSGSKEMMPPLLESAIQQMNKSLRSLFSLLFCRGQDGPVNEKLLTTICRIQEMMQERLKDYSEYLLVKEQRNVAMTAYLQSFPGLVHFIYVDRTSDQVIAPSIYTTADRVFDSRDPCHVIKQKIWDMWNYVHTYVVQGCTFVAVRDGDFLYSYCLWFEDASGNPVPLQNPIPAFPDVPPLGILCGTYFKDITLHGFPATTQQGAVRCYELMCVHIGLLPVRFAAKHIRQLASALFQTSLGAHYPIGLIQ